MQFSPPIKSTKVRQNYNGWVWGDHVSRYDRYVLSQYLIFFGFFALILVAVFWVNRAVVLFDTLIGNGQSALVFLEFTALTLPNLIRMVLPIAAFGAAVWVTNRLNSESELTVLRATGTSPWQMARPALGFRPYHSSDDVGANALPAAGLDQPVGTARKRNLAKHHCQNC